MEKPGRFRRARDLRERERNARRTADRRARDRRASRAARGRLRGVRASRQEASARLGRLRQGGILAVSLTALLLLYAPGATQEPASQETAAVVADTTAAAVADTGRAPSAAESVEEARSTLERLWDDFIGLLPKITIAVGLLVLAALLSRLVRAGLRRALRAWQRAEAVSALAAVLLWLLAVGVALSVLAGDVRALVGSVGLIGLALSWALQAPIESFTGWLMNSFRGYYRVGDRIAVGEVFGDVYQIDFLTTTVWEAGGPGKAVEGAQPTGGVITFPNSEVLRANITNYTRDFEWVWDELTIGVTNDTDLRYALDVMKRTAAEVVGAAMEGPAQAYGRLLAREDLPADVATEPEVFASPAESWTDLTVRYLVPARERRRWSRDLLLAVNEAFARPEHAERIRTGYPRTQIELLREPPTD